MSFLPPSPTERHVEDPWEGPLVIGRDPTPFGGLAAGPVATGSPDFLGWRIVSWPEDLRGAPVPSDVAIPGPWAEGLSHEEQRRELVRTLGEQAVEDSRIPGPLGEPSRVGRRFSTEHLLLAGGAALFLLVLVAGGR